MNYLKLKNNSITINDIEINQYISNSVTNKVTIKNVIYNGVSGQLELRKTNPNKLVFTPICYFMYLPKIKGINRHKQYNSMIKTLLKNIKKDFIQKDKTRYFNKNYTITIHKTKSNCAIVIERNI